MLHVERRSLIEVSKLAQEDRFDYLVIESTGISEPLPVAETFTFADEDGTSLSDVARLDTMVTVVDAVNFLRDFDEAKYLNETAESLGEEDERSVADLLIDQIEFADVILISKSDLVSEGEVSRLEAVINSLNPDARVIATDNGDVDLDAVIDTGRFDFEKAQRAPGWLKECVASTCLKPKSMGLVALPTRPGGLFTQKNSMPSFTRPSGMGSYSVLKVSSG